MHSQYFSCVQSCPWCCPLLPFCLDPFYCLQLHCSIAPPSGTVLIKVAGEEERKWNSGPSLFDLPFEHKSLGLMGQSWTSPSPFVYSELKRSKSQVNYPREEKITRALSSSEKAIDILNNALQCRGTLLYIYLWFIYCA